MLRKTEKTVEIKFLAEVQPVPPSTVAGTPFRPPGWHTRGYDASTIDPEDRGVGWLLAEGGIPAGCAAPG